MKKTLVLLLLLAELGARAQNCPYSPADCPITRQNPFGSPEDSAERLLNPVIPQEVTMENRLRAKTMEWMQRIAAKEGWEVFQLSEDVCDGARDANGNVLAYPMRSPHWLIFHFEFVVNRDSLAAWQSWLEEFAKRRMDNMQNYTDNLSKVQGQVQAMMDSATYYGQKGNSKKMNEFAGKAAALQNVKGTEQADANFEAERNRQRVHFRDASLLVVEVSLNMNFAKTVDGVNLPAPSADPLWMSNPRPDPISIDLFARSQHCVLLLQGPWKRSPLGGGYQAVFVNDKSTTVKRIKCDEVQTVAVHLSGNQAAIRRCLADWPVAEINGMIVR